MYRKPQTVKDVFGDSVLRLLLIILIVVSMFPFVYMLILSLMNTTTMSLNMEKIRTADWTFQNYVNLFKGEGGGMLRFIINSVVVTVYAVVVTCLVSAMAAYVFAKKKFLGRDKLYYVYVMTMMIPAQALLIPTFLLVREMGLINTYTSLALPTFNAFGVMLVRSFMKNLPDDLLEAADIDGCGEIRKFVTIVLPLIKPVMVSLAIFTFISVWGSLLWPLVVASGDMTTITQAVANMKGALSKPNYGYIMSATTVAFLPPFILYVFLQKQFVEGIALSGIKG